ncbi:signal transduction histidine kinase [Microbacterium kyungheense]|uniref:histidine kinase n=2 Tax=Microbacteriaceae TaxID=85023 RepID=A0A543F0L8_9MICO|nr:signal transduction histidine kinase [Microbacterium kyungheense]
MDADALLVRRTAVRVGVWLTIAVSLLVLAVLAAGLTFVLTQVPLREVFDPSRHEEMVDVGGLDIIVGGVSIGVLAVASAGLLGLLATRRAVAPLVDALSRQRRFVADASHELRTPLAVLDTRLQVLERSLAADDPHRALVGELRDDSRNIINVVNDLLDSVDTTATGDAKPIAIRPVIDGAVAAMRLLAQEKQVTLETVAVPDDLAAAIPDTSLHRALVALLDNAVKHSPAGSVVRVTAAGDRRWTLISVSDQGGGISGIDPGRIFDRFARSSSTVDGGGSSSVGFGIGLNLVQDTVGRFGGSVEVTATSGDGTTLTLRLPRPRR